MSVNVESLLIELIRETGHLHEMQHRLERKVDYLIEVAAAENDDAEKAARIRAGAEKLRASSGDLKKTVEETGAKT